MAKKKKDGGKKESGGKRSNAGRKPIDDKKITVILYVKESIINNFEGIEQLKGAIYSYITDAN